MILDILNDEFLTKDAERIIIQIIHVAIKYHEQKIIAHSDDEEYVRSRESRIIELHKYLYETIEYISQATYQIDLKAQIILSNSRKNIPG
ncbi:hypothetical protein [Pedobacter cryophilus]|uniref:Uncharacterized protein n=1 Tax=Pedobacter cryophilus TaxID=2571271 RepID=A0A4U1BZD7_9SPHI|nr:hypothetical protein [Pedobacter cryophilus]TKB97878.1 hypothetical protein FA046_11050 [Pedobacter cryophilus]